MLRPRWRTHGARGLVAVLGMALTLTMGVVYQPAFAADPDDVPTIEVDSGGLSDAQADDVLGVDSSTSHDIAFTVLGDAESLTVLRSSAADGYRWEAFAAINVPPVESDLWISNHCITESGGQMVVVYGPRTLMNDEAGALGGGWAAIVDLASGVVTELGRGFTLAYFNPGCGSGDRVALTRYPSETETQLAVVDAATGEVVARMSTKAQVTSAVPLGDERVLGVTGEGIVAISRKGERTTVIKPGGLAYGLTIAQDRVGYLVRSGADDAHAMSASLSGKRQPRLLATGPITQLGLTARGGELYLLGEPAKIADSSIPLLSGARPGAEVSSEGLIAINATAPAGMVEPEVVGGGLLPSVEAVAAKTGQELVFSLEIGDPVAKAPASDGGKPPATGEDDAQAPGAVVAPQAMSIQLLAEGSPTDPIEGTNERYCSVPRNDPHNQAFQPKPRNVEWAVDRAVKGQLTEVRPSNWRGLGMPAYQPQVLIPPTPLIGGGSIPPQIVLGVLAQESNLWQASRYTAPGETGNPLIGDFYGSRPEDSEPPQAIWNIDFPDADCGYGVGQITDGMRLAGKQGSGKPPAYPFDTQRAIALDYTANVAMTVRMLGLKWNEIEAAGMEINNGDPSRIENWFYAVWIYNTGFHHYDGAGPWGVGWFNNPINPIYPPFRGPFLDWTAADAAHPQDWPYPEKVMGFAAHSVSLIETQLADANSRTYPATWVAAFRTAWWNGEGQLGEIHREEVKPPVNTFCEMSENSCDAGLAAPCTLAGEPECWWHSDATWKSDCAYECGYGFERFPSSYSTEASSMAPSLPAITLQPSFPAACTGSPASGALVVDDTTHASVRTDCTRRPSSGTFGFTFQSPLPNGSYSSKVDLHQLGGGWDGHFYFSHMRKSPDSVDNVSNRLRITGKWTLGQQLHQWTRVWIHVPDHAGWTDQAGYTVTFGDGGSALRYLPQRRYANSWVPLGVFPIDGAPTVSLSNITVNASAGDNPNHDDVAWDAVAFQPLAAKPAEFVVALGDSFASGEGAGSYAGWSDHDGESTGLIDRNGCHQSADAWIRKTALPDSTFSIGQREANKDVTLDFHFLACSGAESEHLLPFHTWGGPGDPPGNAEEQTGADGQYRLVSQLDAGYLDDNTTLVALSIGGNDMRFAPILAKCVVGPSCETATVAGDSQTIPLASAYRLENELPDTIATVITQIQDRAENADIVLMGYPRLFDQGGSCIGVGEHAMLNQIADGLRDVLAQAAADHDEPGQRVIFVDPQPFFQGHTLCTPSPAINTVMWAPFHPRTPGDLPAGIFADQAPAWQESVHPNDLGTSMYSDALEDALDEIYP